MVDCYSAAERVEMRHWLRSKDIEPVMGQTKEVTARLMYQVQKEGQDPEELMKKGRHKVDIVFNKV